MRANFARAAEIAARQHGCITVRQLREDCDFTNSTIQRGVEAERLFRLHQGVYAVGYRSEHRESGWQAAVLACGDDASLSVRCAATAWQMRDGVGPRIDVTIPSGSHRKRPGIDIHRCDLLPFERTVWQEIPITSPARTMVDLAHELKDRPEEIEWAMRQMQFHRLFDRKLLELSYERRPLRALGRLFEGIEPTRSPLEVAFLQRVVGRYDLPAPEVNAKVLGYLVDFFWPEAGLVVETDGRQHDQPLQKRADAYRDELHRAAGLTVRRFRSADVLADHERTAREILRLWRELTR